jgi:hypothetical protein
MNSWLLLRRLRGPAFLILVGFTALLNQWGILSFGRSWPLYLILAGIFGLAERAVMAASPPVAPPAYPGAYTPAPYSPGGYSGAYGSGPGYTGSAAQPAPTHPAGADTGSGSAGNDPFIDPDRRS